MSFAYETFLQGMQTGFAVAPSAWVSYHLALVEAGYVPDQLTDATLADVTNIADDGKTGVFPTFTVTINGSGATPEAGLQFAILTGIWDAVPAGPNITQLVLYAITVGVTTQLIALYNNWGGLPITPDGTDITLVSLPNPAQANGVNMVRNVTTVT